MLGKCVSRLGMLRCCSSRPLAKTPDSSRLAKVTPFFDLFAAPVYGQLHIAIVLIDGEALLQNGKHLDQQVANNRDSNGIANQVLDVSPELTKHPTHSACLATGSQNRLPWPDASSTHVHHKHVFFCQHLTFHTCHQTQDCACLRQDCLCHLDQHSRGTNSERHQDIQS